MAAISTAIGEEYGRTNNNSINNGACLRSDEALSVRVGQAASKEKVQIKEKPLPKEWLVRSLALKARGSSPATRTYRS